MNPLKKLRSNQTVVLVALVLVAGIVGFGATYLLASRNKNEVASQVNCTGTCVNLLGSKASPDTLAVTVGSYVTFNSADGQSHELTLGDPSKHGHADAGSFESGVFKSDESFKVQFKQEGTYRFTDKLHQETTIIIVVYTEGKEYKI